MGQERNRGPRRDRIPAHPDGVVHRVAAWSTKSSHPLRIFDRVSHAAAAVSTASTSDTCDDLLRGLTAAQLEAVTSTAQPLCVLAGAGAGKTRVLTRRVAYRCRTATAQARHVLVVTFTRKAAGELVERLEHSGMSEKVTAGTFHSIAAAQLRRRWADRGQQAPALLERKSRLLGPVVSSRPRLEGADLGALAGEIEWAKSRLVTPSDYEAAAAAARRSPPAPAGEVAALFARYEHEKRRRGLLDFDDLLSECAAAMEADAEFAAAQRWRWRHLFVDEFQDVNPLQHRLLTAWLGSSLDLCVVGDPNQSIYGWNGSDPRLLAGFSQAWPSSEVVHLGDNHRCSPQVVLAASRVLAGGASGEGPGGTRPRSTRPDGPEPRVRAYSSELAEAEGVAFELRRARRDAMAWSDMAVLVRTNAQLATLRPALQAAGIPFWDPNGAALLEHPAARAALAELRAAPRRNAQAAAADIEDMAASAPDEDAASVLGAVAQLSRQYLRMLGTGDAADLLGWLSTAAGGDPPAPRSEAVTLCSFHRAKGLEWQAVWLCGLERGLVPVAQTSGTEAEAEERRLLYVACTRASEVLRCSWSEQRSIAGRLLRRQPSPWLGLIASTEADTGTARGGDQRNRRGRAGGEAGHPVPFEACVREARSTLAHGRGRVQGRLLSPLPLGWPEPAPELIGALDSWRRQVARGSGVPAQAVLHDRTLEALASLRPSTTDELLKVPGIGPVKATRFGERLIEVVAGAQSREAGPAHA